MSSLDALARPDKWYLSAGEGVIWAPPFPRHLDRPGFWDEGHVFHFPVRPLFGVALVDGRGREIPLRRGPTRWRPDRLRVRWRTPAVGPDLLEERAVLPGARFASVWTLDDDGWRHPALETAWLAAFTQLPAGETVLLRGDSLRWTRDITHRRHLSATIGFELVASAPGRARVVWSEGRETPSWALTPFPELWREGAGLTGAGAEAAGAGGGDWAVPAGAGPAADSTAPTSGWAHAALAVPLATVDPGAPVSFTLGARLGGFGAASGPGAGDPSATESARHVAVAPARAGEGSPGWEAALSSYPRFRCSDPYLERYWDYRVYGLHLNRLAPVPGGYPHPSVAEGIEYFHWPISYSAQCHMLETRWAGDPAVARGSLLNFLAAQRDDGSLPGRLHLCPDAPVEPDFYHASWGDAVLAVEALHPDDDFAAAAYTGLARYARWLTEARDPERSGMVTVTNHYETGQEYMSRYVAVDPEADRTEWEPRLALKGIDVTVYLHRLQRALAVLARRLGRPDEAARWRDAAEASGGAIVGRMWDPGTGFFSDVDGRTGERTGVKAAVCFYPMLTDLLDDDRVARLLAHLTDPGEFWTRWPVPSSSVDDPFYDPDGLWKGVRHNCPWNGRVWPMTNSHVVDGLLRQWRAGRRDVGPVAAELLTRFVRMMFDEQDPARPNCFEHYNPDTAHPSRFRGIDDYQHSWVLDLLVRGVAGLDPDNWLASRSGPGPAASPEAAESGGTRRERGGAGAIAGRGPVVVDPLPMGLDTVDLEGAVVRGRCVDVRIRGEVVGVVVDGVEYGGRVGEPVEIEIEDRDRGSRGEGRGARGR